MALALLMLSSVCAYDAGAEENPPTLSCQRSGPPSGLAGGRDVVWDQPPDLNGGRFTSEVISNLGLMSEIADDFVASWWMNRIRMWGGYYNWSPGDPEITSLNLRFYEDVGSYPGAVAAEYFGLPVEAEFVTSDPYGPIYEYVICGSYDFLVGGRRYWISFQAGDHPYPPQWGRQKALDAIDAPAMIRSDFFGCPNWTPLSDLVGIWPLDTSFQLESVVGGMGACCLPDGSCVYTYNVYCGDWLHGIYYDCVHCWNVQCDGPAACCFPDGSCLMLTDWGCRDQGGEPQVPGTACDPNPCQPTPVEPTTWGRIRGGYR